MRVTEFASKLGSDKSDWFGWLRTDDGIAVRVQIGFQATVDRANEILRQMATDKQ